MISSDGAQSLYAAVNLFNDGNDVKTTTSTSTYYMQTCLASPRRVAASLTLTLAGQDETTGIAKAKKGEQMAATIDVKDAAGQPMKNVMVKISREFPTRAPTAPHRLQAPQTILRYVM